MQQPAIIRCDIRANYCTIIMQSIYSWLIFPWFMIFRSLPQNFQKSQSCSGHPIKMFRFPSPFLLWRWVSRSAPVGQNKNEHMKGPSGCQWRPLNKTRSSACKLKYLLLDSVIFFTFTKKNFVETAYLPPTPPPPRQIPRSIPNRSLEQSPGNYIDHT